MLRLNIILLVSAIFAFCDSSAILDKINKKCSMSDDECVQGLYEDLIQEIAENGIPEMDVPIADPLVIKDEDVVVLGMIKITMKDGVVKGLKNCHATSFKSDLATHRHAIDFVCDLFTIEGNYKIESTPTLLALIGGIDIHGEGNGGIVLEKLHIAFDFAFEFKKFDDGEIHVQILPDDSSFILDVQGKATVRADNVLVGTQEISTVLVNIFNENWEFLTNQFGNSIVEKAMTIFFKHAQVFFNKTPAKELITDDLSSHVKS